MLKFKKFRTILFAVGISLMVSTTAHAATSNVSVSTYKIQSGDSLYKISQKFHTSIAWLQTTNNIKTSLIFAGQTISVPSQNTTTKTTQTYTQSDVDLLARLIHSESQGEPYNAQVAVGAVIMNRLKSPLFPKTITNVIYEKDGPYYQFTPVLNGAINEPADSSALSAAKDALSGVDPTNGALYYFDDSATNAWLRAKPVALTIDKMIFSYR
ncbi:cell wall hydrolase [Clostridium akagii]|uniref:cell wall hydrolase n=1 Tax=Clostridium akagii TaxID=91623 RepID=UPI00047E2AE1|nr:cell wall hydrolase [Clostridium akagii]